MSTLAILPDTCKFKILTFKQLLKKKHTKTQDKIVSFVGYS